MADQYVYTQREILAAVKAIVGPGPQLNVPALIPRLMESMVRWLVPVARWRINARSRYWKYCERNVYAADKLVSHGFRSTPDLLAVHSPTAAPERANGSYV